MTGSQEGFGGSGMLDRRELMKRAGMAALATGLGSSRALALDSVTLPFDNGERPLVRYPQKRPMIGLTQRPPQLETPFSIFNDGAITPNNAFFVRYHLADVPYDIDPDKFTLEVKGKIDRPLKLSLRDIKKLKAVELVAVNQCSGNSRGFLNPRVAGGQLGNGAMGNARWRGVPLKAVLDMAGVQQGARQVTFNGMDGPVSDKTPDFVKALDIDHARDGEVMLAYGMNGDDLPVLNGFPLRLVVPGYYGTYWVKHLNEITVIDNVFEGFWMKSAYRIPDNAQQQRRARHGAEGDHSDQPLHGALVHHQCHRRRQAEAGRDHAERHRIRRRQGHQGSRRLHRRRQNLDAGKARPGSRKIFVPRMEAAGETCGGRATNSRCAPPTTRRYAADDRFGIPPAICATSSKPFASRRLEENIHGIDTALT